MRKITSGIRTDIRGMILTGTEFFLSKLKRFIRWLIFGAILFFLMAVLREHWQEVGILSAFTTYNISQLPMLLSAFSIAWVTALVVPGAPGGIGVFEATAIALLAQPFSTAVVFSAAALYRLISIIAETLAVGMVWLDEKLDKYKKA